MEKNNYSLLELNRRLVELDNQYEIKIKEFDEYKSAYKRCRNNILENINLTKHSVDTEKFNHGLNILRLQFPDIRRFSADSPRYGEMKADIINDAKRDLANGAPKLKKVYFGQKYYECYDQREDHEYGMGPRHGSIYQRIGLKNPSSELSDYDLECALYVLENIELQLENLNLTTKE